MRGTAVRLVGLALLVAVLVPTVGTRGGASHELGTPAAATPSARAAWIAESLGVAELATPDDPTQQVALTRVTLPPGGGTEAHVHEGVGVLYVESGTVCFELISAPGPFTVKVLRETRYPDDAGCEVPSDQCWDSPNGCPLEAGQTVLLSAGDSVSQGAGPSEHNYWNVGSEPAVVLIAELQRPEDGAGCGGSCL